MESGMNKIFENYGFRLTEGQLRKFEIYREVLTEYNEKFNLTAITDGEGIAVKHFVDSILPLKFFNEGTAVDIGTGAGFPLLPLKIMNDALKITLLEATGKKCEFLREALKRLDISGAEIINDRAEAVAKQEKYREKFDYAVARAVARMNVLCEYCLPFVKVKGSFIAYKGDVDEELKEAERAVEILGGRIEKKEEYSLNGEKRSAVKIVKVSATPKEYPRGQGKERKKPL